jgi:hypothetical protein
MGAFEPCLIVQGITYLIGDQSQTETHLTCEKTMCGLWSTFSLID